MRVTRLRTKHWRGLLLRQLDPSAQEAMPKARAAAEKSLALDPTLSGARTTLGLVAGGYDWNWAEAERVFAAR